MHPHICTISYTDCTYNKQLLYYISEPESVSLSVDVFM